MCVAVLGLVALAGCGGSSSKPAYCSARTNLQNAIQEITSLSPTSGISALQAAFTKVKAEANAAVSAAGSDFPTETNAIRSSMNALNSAVSALRANPSAGQIATVVGAAGNVVNSFKGFVNATASKCG